MKSIADSSVTIQTSSLSVPATPCWFGEVTLMAHYLRHQGVLALLEERVRFARRRFGRYDLIDFVAVLLGYAISGERTLEADLASACSLLPTRSWPCSNGISCRTAPPSVVFLLPSMNPLSKRCERCFSQIWWPVLWRRKRNWVGCGIGREPTTWSSMSMVRGKPRANEPCHAHRIFRPRSVGCARSALLAISDASAERS